MKPVITHPPLKNNRFAGPGQPLTAPSKKRLRHLNLPDRNNQNAAQVSGPNLEKAIGDPDQVEDPLRTSLRDNADPFMAMFTDGKQPRIDRVRRKRFAGILG